MRAAIYREFGGPIQVEDVDDPILPGDGVVIRVGASGLCRSDLHAWDGHDSGIALPHVPGHELAGTIEAMGAEVEGFAVGERVTVPFAVGCGSCDQCRSGNEQVCDDEFQPGFTAWGSFAELVAIPHADGNLVRLPEEMGTAPGSMLGCRFATAYRAVAQQGRPAPGEWVAVHGCGGLGLSTVMIARAMGASVVAVDINAGALSRARSLGAEIVIDAGSEGDVARVIREITGGGAALSMDTFGSGGTASSSILGLRKGGRHVQVGLLNEEESPIPMGSVISRELEIVGSHGMAARYYPQMLAFMAENQIDPGLLIDREISLDQLPAAIEEMRRFSGDGVTVITGF